MKIIYKQGDFLEGPETFRLHGCNAQGVMGSGAALAVRNKYPEVYKSYVESHAFMPFKTGEILPVIADDNTIFINAITQKNFGRDKNVVYVDYDAVETAIKNTDDWMALRWRQKYEVAMPKIGAGLANGDWEIISKIIEEKSLHFQPVVYIM